MALARLSETRVVPTGLGCFNCSVPYNDETDLAMVVYMDGRLTWWHSATEQRGCRGKLKTDEETNPEVVQEEAVAAL